MPNNCRCHDGTSIAEYQDFANDTRELNDLSANINAYEGNVDKILSAISAEEDTKSWTKIVRERGRITKKLATTSPGIMMAKKSWTRNPTIMIN